MASSKRGPLDVCRSALIQRFRQIAPGIALNENGYVGEASQNLIEGVRLADFEADLRQGSGNELEGKFRAVYSSSALAVNTFAPFRSNRADLRLPAGKFDNLSFERKCANGLRGSPPNLDVVADGANNLIAIESKCLEPLTSHSAKFAEAYHCKIRDDRRQTAWFQEMLKLMDEPHTYRWLDAAQLVKHALGLMYTFVGRPMNLLYLFWEPSNSEDFSIFSEHRADVEQFAAAVDGGGPKFISLSYPELWRSWEACVEPEWLPLHVRRLKARYDVAV